MRKIVIILSVPLLFGCMGGDRLTSWDGQKATDLVFAWGAPDKQEQLPDGRQVLSYDSSHDIKGTSYACEAMFRVNAAGIVESTTASGNIGGCNGLLLSKPSAK